MRRRCVETALPAAGQLATPKFRAAGLHLPVDLDGYRRSRLQQVGELRADHLLQGVEGLCGVLVYAELPTPKRVVSGIPGAAGAA